MHHQDLADVPSFILPSHLWFSGVLHLSMVMVEAHCSARLVSGHVKSEGFLAQDFNYVHIPILIVLC